MSINVHPESDGKISVLPNPVSISAVFQISYVSSVESQAAIRIVDITGKTINRLETELLAGENRISLKAPGVPGIYSVQLQNRTGEVRALKLVVQ